METLIAYFIKVNIALIIFYLLYIAFLKKDTFFAFRRYFLFVAIAFSFAYPFISVSAWGNIISFEKPQEYTSQVVVGEPSFVVLADEGQLAEPVNRITIDWWQVLLYILSAGIIFFFARFIWQLVSILHIKHKSVRKNIDGIQVFDLHDEITPFSFFRWIFIHIDSHSHTEIKQILLHEQTHARQWHSADVILMELLCVFFWWNPIVWLMKRETAINLEYLADNDVLRQGINCRDYQYHLLRLTYHQNASQIVNNFNVTQLKQRITMMNETKSPARKLVKYLIALPLAFLLVAGNSVYAKNDKSNYAMESQQSSQKKVSKSNYIFTNVEKQAQFVNGSDALLKYIKSEMKYPKDALINNVMGRVFVNFIIEKDGSISDVKIFKGVNESLDKEAIRIIESMPKWIPAEQNGEIVRVRYNSSINFVLPAELNTEGLTIQTNDEDKNDFFYKQDKAYIDHFETFSEMILFPGGEEAYNKFVIENIKYPEIAKDKGIQGFVSVNYAINKDGEIYNIKVRESADPILDKEVVNTIKSMPKWIIRDKDKYGVSVKNLPVIFRLQNDKASEYTGVESENSFVVVGYGNK